MYKVAYTEETCLRFTNIGGQAEGLNDPPNFFKKIFIFYWWIIALQNFVVFCQTSTWISHRYTYIFTSLWNSLPSPSPFYPSGLIQSPCLFPEPYSKFPLAIYFVYGNVSFHVTLPKWLTLSSPLPMSISQFSMSVSPLLPWK